MHVYHVESGKPVAVLLRPGKTPSGAEVRTMLMHLTRRIRRHWPRTRLTFQGDSHYGQTEAMAWCEANGVDYILGLEGNAVLHRLAYHVSDDVRVRRAEAGAERLRGFDARYIVTSLKGEPRHLYEGTWCARGQAKNLIRQHNAQLASHRTSCQSPLANLSVSKCMLGTHGYPIVHPKGTLGS